MRQHRKQEAESVPKRCPFKKTNKKVKQCLWILTEGEGYLLYSENDFKKLIFFFFYFMDMVGKVTSSYLEDF